MNGESAHLRAYVRHDLYPIWSSMEYACIVHDDLYPIQLKQLRIEYAFIVRDDLYPIWSKQLCMKYAGIVWH